jgi:hypothetical protein
VEIAVSLQHKERRTWSLAMGVALVIYVAVGVENWIRRRMAAAHASPRRELAGEGKGLSSQE